MAAEVVGHFGLTRLQYENANRGASTNFHQITGESRVISFLSRYVTSG